MGADDNAATESIGVFARLKPVTDDKHERGDVQIKSRFGKSKNVQASPSSVLM